jgi:hypothetical protein
MTARTTYIVEMTVVTEVEVTEEQYAEAASIAQSRITLQKAKIEAVSITLPQWKRAERNA